MIHTIGKHVARHVVDAAVMNSESLTPEQKFLLAATGTSLVFILATHPAFLSMFPRMVKRLRFKNRDDGIWLGRDFISDFARLRHTQISGATGMGKTVLIENLLFSDLTRGYGALIIDPKGERGFYDSVKAYCESIGRGDDLYLLSATHADESSVWNPCALGNASELQTKFFNSAIYNEPHYAKACEFGLLKAFKSLTNKKNAKFTLLDLISRLEGIASDEKEQTLKGLFYDLNNLVYGEWEEVLGCSTAKSGSKAQGKKEISILDIVSNNKILFVDLPTEGKKVQSSRIGRLLTQEIILISGMRKRNPRLMSKNPFSVYIDEFDAFATESFSTFLNKGRSSRFMIHLAHQTLSDLNIVSPEFTGQIMGNCNLGFIFRHGDPDDAEKWARFLGTRLVTKSTYRTQDGSKTGESSNRQTQEFIVSPDVIKSLPIGRCVYSNKIEQVCHVIKVPMSEEANAPDERHGAAGAQSPVEPPDVQAHENPKPKDLELEGVASDQKKDWNKFL